MAMAMLQAGGLTIATDGLRRADDNNPAGYFEFERVKTLDKDADKSWLRDIRGQAIKIISYLLAELPDSNNYRVIFMQRPIEEVLRSQQTMLRDMASAPDSVPDERLAAGYERHLEEVAALLWRRSCFEVLKVDYVAAVADPVVTALRVNEFLGGGLNVPRMTAVIDQRLHRNRTSSD